MQMYLCEGALNIKVCFYTHAQLVYTPCTQEQAHSSVVEEQMTTGAKSWWNPLPQQSD